MNKHIDTNKLISDMINELTSLEIYFEQGRDRARKARQKLQKIEDTAPKSRLNTHIEELKIKSRNRMKSRMLKHSNE